MTIEYGIDYVVSTGLMSTAGGTVYMDTGHALWSRIDFLFALSFSRYHGVVSISIYTEGTDLLPKTNEVLTNTDPQIIGKHPVNSDRPHLNLLGYRGNPV